MSKIKGYDVYVVSATGGKDLDHRVCYLEFNSEFFLEPRGSFWLSTVSGQEEEILKVYQLGELNDVLVDVSGERWNGTILGNEP